jgi:hypothetical protein
VVWYSGLRIYRNIAVGSHIDQDTQDHIPPTSDHDSFAGRTSSLALALMSGRSVVAEGIQ